MKKRIMVSIILTLVLVVGFWGGEVVAQSETTEWILSPIKDNNTELPAQPELRWSYIGGGIIPIPEQTLSPEWFEIPVEDSIFKTYIPITEIPMTPEIEYPVVSPIPSDEILPTTLPPVLPVVEYPEIGPKASDD